MRWICLLLPAAIAAGSGLLRAEPEGDRAKLLSNSGIRHYESGRDRTALAEFREALKLDPDLVAANLFAGLTLIRLGQPASAIPFLQRANEKDSSGVLPAVALARAHVALRNFERANQYYHEATRRDPRSAEAWFGAGITSRRLLDRAAAAGLPVEKYRKDALEALTRAVELDPTSQRAHMLLAESLRESNNLAEAVEEYQSAIRAQPDSAAAYLGMAAAYWKTGDTVNAMPALEKALQLAPNDPEANGIMADLLVRRGEYNPARTYINRALKGNPDLPHVRVSLAKIHLAEGHPGQAIAEVQKALPYDATGSYHYLLYQALKKLNRNQEAADALAESQRRRSGGVGSLN